MLNKVFREEIGLLKSLKRKIDTGKVGESIHKRQFTMKDAGISSRLLNHWEKSGLLMESYEERKWKKFNLIEYTWLKIVAEMRRYDLSHEIIRKAKESIVFEFGIDDMPNKEEVYEIIMEISEAHLKERVENLIKSAEMKSLLNDFKINFLELVILYTILIKGNYSILVNIEGICIPFKHANFDDYLQYDEFSEFLSGTFISISVTDILKEFILENEFTLPKKKLSLLSESESQVIRTIREEEVKSVIIKKGNSNEIDLIEELRNENIDKATRLMDIILKHGYQTIEITTQDGNIVHCANVIKQKIQHDNGTA